MVREEDTVTFVEVPQGRSGVEAARCPSTSGLEVPPLSSGLPQPKAAAPDHAGLESTDSSKAQRVGEVGTSTGRLNTIGNMAIAPWVDYITQCLF